MPVINSRYARVSNANTIYFQLCTRQNLSALELDILQAPLRTILGCNTPAIKATEDYTYETLILSQDAIILDFFTETYILVPVLPNSTLSLSSTFSRQPAQLKGPSIILYPRWWFNTQPQLRKPIQVHQLTKAVRNKYYILLLPSRTSVCGILTFVTATELSPHMNRSDTIQAAHQVITFPKTAHYHIKRIRSPMGPSKNIQGA